MAPACYATLCVPDALLHGSDLLHWQTLRCLSGLGLLHLENSLSADLLFGVPQSMSSLGHQRSAISFIRLSIFRSVNSGSVSAEVPDELGDASRIYTMQPAIVSTCMAASCAPSMRDPST